MIQEQFGEVSEVLAVDLVHITVNFKYRNMVFNIPVDHMQGSYVFVPYIKSLGLDNLVFASPDVGGVSRVRNFASFFK